MPESLHPATDSSAAHEQCRDLYGWCGSPDCKAKPSEGDRIVHPWGGDHQVPDTAALHRVADFDLSMALWGYDVAGDIGEVGATVSEWPSFETLTMVGPLWDRDELWRRSILLNGEPPPERMCLPWITEWSMQRDAAHA